MLGVGRHDRAVQMSNSSGFFLSKRYSATDIKHQILNNGALRSRISLKSLPHNVMRLTFASSIIIQSLVKRELLL